MKAVVQYAKENGAAELREVEKIERNFLIKIKN